MAKKRHVSSAKIASRKKLKEPDRQRAARASPPLAQDAFEAVIRGLVKTPAKRRGT